MTEIDLWNQALAEVGDYRITLAASKVISSATAANPVVATVTSHGYLTDDLILVTAMDQLTQVNGRIFRIAVVNANSFQLVGEDGSAGVAESTGGLAQKLSTGDHVSAVFTVWPSMRREVLEEHSWNDATRYIRLARRQAAKTITGITQAAEAVVTSVAHGYSSGDLVLIEAVLGMVELNGRQFSITVLTVDTFKLNGEDSTTYTAYSSAGTAKKALTPLKPDFGYAYRYTLPSDCVQVLSFAEEGREAAQWETVGTEVYTDEGITVPIRYTTLLKDPAAFGAKLFSALCARLAHEVAPKLADSVSREERAEKRWDKQLAAAQRADGKEQGASTLSEGSWVLARLGGDG